MRKVEIEILEGKVEEGDLDRAVEIIAGGIFAFLEEGGYLREEGKEEKG